MTVNCKQFITSNSTYLFPDNDKGSPKATYPYLHLKHCKQFTEYGKGEHHCSLGSNCGETPAKMCHESKCYFKCSGMEAATWEVTILTIYLMASPGKRDENNDKTTTTTNTNGKKQEPGGDPVVLVLDQAPSSKQGDVQLEDA